MWSRMVLTASSTSFAESCGCLLSMRSISSDFVITVLVNLYNRVGRGLARRKPMNVGRGLARQFVTLKGNLHLVTLKGNLLFVHYVLCVYM